MRIGFVTARDPRSRKSWSGTHYYMARALQKHCGQVELLGPVSSVMKPLAGSVALVAEKVLGRRYYHNRNLLLAKRYSKLMADRIARLPLDLLVCSFAPAETAFLKTTLPIIYISDSTFAAMIDYYPTYTRLLGISVREGNSVEGRALRKAGLLLYPSRWAAESAASDYHMDPGRIHVVPFGANFDEPPDGALVRGKVHQSDICRLLFLAKEWERKGGDIAFETLTALHQSGVPAHLTVCGVVPPEGITHPSMTVIPFLNKDDEGQRRRLHSLFLESDFLLLPTRAECFGLVFCEASAFGLPSVTTNTGGVSSVIDEGRNGFMLPVGARGDEYARIISRVWADKGYCRALTKSSRETFEEKLNWDAWAASFIGILARSGLMAGQQTAVASGPENP